METTKTTGAGSTLLAGMIFAVLILLAIALLFLMGPTPLLFSEDFEGGDIGVVASPSCPCVPVIEQGRLRITIPQSRSGLAVQLPNNYAGSYTLRAAIYPVEDVHDASINILLNQSEKGGYEIELRPKAQQVIMYIRDKDTVRSPTEGWKEALASQLNSSRNELRVTVTDHSIHLWLNDAPVFIAYFSDRLEYDRGTISIGAGAGEAGGIAFEFDDLAIYREGLYPRWLLDREALQVFQNGKDDIQELNSWHDTNPFG